MNVVGLDLSLTGTGIAYPDGTTAVFDTSKMRGMDRILWLRAAIAEHIASCAPHLVVIEDYAFSRGGHAHETGELGGVVKARLIDDGQPYAIVGPTNLKRYALGKGNGKGTDKIAMGVAAYKRSGTEFADDNQCDAAWLRWMALDYYGEPAFEMPSAHRAALSVVPWPSLTQGIDA